MNSNNIDSLNTDSQKNKARLKEIEIYLNSDNRYKPKKIELYFNSNRDKPRESIDLIEKQIMYEEKYNKRLRKELIKDAFIDVVKPLTDILEDASKDPSISMDQYKDSVDCLNIIYEVLTILAEHTLIPLKTVFAILIDKNELSDINTNIDKIMDAILIADQYEMLSINYLNKGVTLQTKYTLSDELLHRLNQFKYLNPMLCEPVKTNVKNNNRGSGYLTVDNDSLILGGVWHKEDIDSTVLDRFNQTVFELNLDVIYSYRNKWSDLDKPKLKSLERETDETVDQWKKRVHNFERYEKATYDTFAEMIHEGNTFYLTHKYDKRGRIYCSGYSISYQSNSYAKAVLNLKNKGLITEEINFFD